jgi:hypothetical protein
MDFGEILRVVRKRWYITVPGTLLAVVLTIVAYLVVPTQYQSMSTLSLINSVRPVTAPGNGNPFLTFESSLTATADFLARSLMSEDTARELKGMGVTEEYTAGLADNAMGPFVTLTVTGTVKGHVFRSTEVLTDYAKKKLRTMQEQSGAPETSMIHAATIIPPQPPEPVIKKKIEIVAGAAGGILVLTFVATFLMESFTRSRRRLVRLPDGTELKLNQEADLTAEIYIPRPRVNTPRTPIVPVPPLVNGTRRGEAILPKVEEPKVSAVYRSSARSRRNADVGD